MKEFGYLCQHAHELVAPELMKESLLCICLQGTSLEDPGDSSQFSMLLKHTCIEGKF